MLRFFHDSIWSYVPRQNRKCPLKGTCPPVENLWRKEWWGGGSYGSRLQFTPVVSFQAILVKPRMWVIKNYSKAYQWISVMWTANGIRMARRLNVFTSIKARKTFETIFYFHLDVEYHNKNPMVLYRERRRKCQTYFRVAKFAYLKLNVASLRALWFRNSRRRYISHDCGFV